jgi:hypothetical protein
VALSLSGRPPLELERTRAKKRPRIHVHAGTRNLPSTEWGSLLGDLTRARPTTETADVEWRIHDKTHLEFAIDYPFGERPTNYGWEAYFFVPDSFRLAQTTYDKRQIYDDLLSYVRLAVPELPFDDLAQRCEAKDPTSWSERLRATLENARGSADGSVSARAAIRRARVFACMVRASGLEAQRAMLELIDQASTPEEALSLAARYSGSAKRISTAYRDIVATSAAMALPEEIIVALRWVDEDLSLFFEALASTASIHLHEKGGRWTEAAAHLACDAVDEARYRRSQDYPSVGAEDASQRLVEHIEFRRHMLKRFTSSVLWLRHEVRDARMWTVHVLYAIAAAVSMAFAVWVTLRATEMQEYLTLYFFLLVASYAVKDRLKAILQVKFSSWAERRFPDRAWNIRDTEREDDLGIVTERAGFRDFRKLPPSVINARTLTREHALEEFARPETVLWHEKQVTLEPREEGALPSPMMTEIFRLNIGSWLAHTDDPTRTITFADPDEGVVCSVTARRVYNLNVVYRLKHEGGSAPWRRIRVVVSRKGIERIDPIV